MAEPKFSTTGGANSYSPGDPNKKKLPNLPYLPGDDPTFVAPLTNTALNAPGVPQQQPPAQTVQPMLPQPNNNLNVRDQAVGSLLNKANAPQQESALQTQVTGQTQNLLTDPTQGFNVDKYKQTQLSNYDDQNAKLFESMRQKFADTADTGTFRKDALGNQLESLKGRRTLESDIDYENRDFKVKSLIDSLAQGRETEKMNQGIKNTPIDNLVKALGATEGVAQRAADVETREDVQGYQTGERLSQEDYQTRQADLDRQLKVATQSKDIAATEKLTQQKALIDFNYLAQTQGFGAAQADLDRRLQEATQNRDIVATEKLTQQKATIDLNYLAQTQGFGAAQADLDRRLQEATQNRDIVATENLTAIKANFDRQMLQQQQTHDAQQADLDRQAAVALQNGDIAGQEKIAKLQSKLTLDRDIQNQGFDGTEAQLERDLKSSLQNKDINATRENLYKQLEMDKYKADQGVELTREQGALNRALEVTLKDMDADTQKAVVELKGKIDTGLLVKEQDWNKIENELKRQQEVLMQEGDIAGALKIEKVKGDIQTAYQERQNTFEDGQRSASQVYNTSERVSAQDNQKVMKYLDAELLDSRAQGDATIAKELKGIDAQIQEAKDARDYTSASSLETLRGTIEATAASKAFLNTKEAMDIQADIDEAAAANNQVRVSELEKLRAANSETFAKSRSIETSLIEQKRFDNEWRMLNNTNSHDETMARLSADLDTAKANGDVGRQGQLMTLQNTLDFAKMREENGYDVAKINLQDKLAQANAAKDFDYATRLKKQELDVTVQESAKNRAIDLAELELKKDGQKFLQYEAMVNAGDPDGAANYLKGELAKQGIKFNPVDAYEQAKRAITTDYELQKDQWKQSHSGSLEGFEDFVNTSLYGDKDKDAYIDDIVTGQFNYQQLKADPKKMAVAEANAIDWKPDSHEEGFASDSTIKFATVPDKNVPFKMGNDTFIRISDVITKDIKWKDNKQFFKAIDIKTGKEITIST